jgi:hypothetical protein
MYRQKSLNCNSAEKFFSAENSALKKAPPQADFKVQVDLQESLVVF